MVDKSFIAIDCIRGGPPCPPDLTPRRGLNELVNGVLSRAQLWQSGAFHCRNLEREAFSAQNHHVWAGRLAAVTGAAISASVAGAAPGAAVHARGSIAAAPMPVLPRAVGSGRPRLREI